MPDVFVDMRVLELLDCVRGTRTCEPRRQQHDRKTRKTSNSFFVFLSVEMCNGSDEMLFLLIASLSAAQD